MKDLFDTEQRYEKAVRSIYSKISPQEDCIVWTGPVKKNGYGQVTLTIATNKTKNFYTHRLFYTLERQIIPVGLEIHHGCFNRLCVNTEHLSLVTHADNMKMLDPKPRNLSSHCSRNHEWTNENTLWSSGRRICRECKRCRERLR